MKGLVSSAAKTSTITTHVVSTNPAAKPPAGSIQGCCGGREANARVRGVHQASTCAAPTTAATAMNGEDIHATPPGSRPASFARIATATSKDGARKKIQAKHTNP